MMNTQRLEKVLKKMETEGLEQMIISDPYAIYYLTGRFIDPGERLLALYINQSGKNKIFINNLFLYPMAFTDRVKGTNNLLPFLTTQTLT